MKSRGLILALLIALTTPILVTSCVVRGRHGRVYVAVAPPPVVVEARTTAPGPEYIWIEGHHEWDGSRYVWVHGRWERRPRAGGEWISGHWERTRRGWYWVEGHWR